MKKFLDKIKEKKFFWLLFACVLALGIFIRTYNFHDWLRFSKDQSRDAFIISNAIEGKEALPLLGPAAGATDFYLGPVYYYFSYISAEIFGNYPDRMAYPSLFFSILAIPLLFYFLKEYFNRNISISLTAIMSVSYFAVINSRFSSNPNLMPFFVLLFLYAFLKILNSKKKDGWFWFLVVGVAIGIGIQLHAILLVVLPVMMLVIFAYLIKQKKVAVFKGFFIVIFIALLLNIPQIVNEIKTQGENSKAFFAVFDSQTDSDFSITKKIVLLSLCQVKANSYIISSVPITEECVKEFDLKLGAKKLFGGIKNKPLPLRSIVFWLSTLASIVFSLAGYFLLVYYFRKEKDEKAKNFLGLFLTFNIISLIFLITVVVRINVNYFIFIFFVPFVLFGLMLKFILEKNIKFGSLIAATLFAVIFIPSILIDIYFFNYYSKNLDNNLDNSNLKQAELMSEYMLEKTNGNNSPKIMLAGQAVYINRFSNSLAYLLRKSEKKIVTSMETSLSEEEKELFFIHGSDSKTVNLENKIQGYETLDGQRYGKVDLFFIRK